MTELNRTVARMYETEPVWLSFPGRAIRFPAIYTPNTQFGQTPGKYVMWAEALRLIPVHARFDDRGRFVEQFTDERGVIRASSHLRPEVLCDDVPGLVRELQGMDARNLNRDRIFAELPIVSFAVTPYRYDVPGGPSGYSLALRKVRVSLLPSEGFAP